MATPTKSDTTPSNAGTSPPSGKPKEGVNVTAVGDPSGTVTNTSDGAGTQQTEPTPEARPASDKITPPAQQTNSRLAPVVGEPGLPLEHATDAEGTDGTDASAGSNVDA